MYYQSSSSTNHFCALFSEFLVYPIRFLHKTCLLRKESLAREAKKGFSFRFRNTHLVCKKRRLPAFFQCTAFSLLLLLFAFACLRAAPFAVCGLKALLTFTHQSGKKVYLISPKASLFFWKRRVIW